MNLFKMLVLLTILISFASPIVTTASDEDQKQNLPEGLKLSLQYWQKSTEKLMEGTLVGVPYQDGGELNGPVWNLTGEYKFHPKWSVEASYAFGSGSGNSYWDSPIGGPYEDGGTYSDDFRKWHINLFFTPFHWQSNNGQVSYFDMGLGYHHLRLEYLTAGWSGGGPGTWYANHTDTLDGIQIGMRGNFALAERFYLKGQIFYLPNFNFEEREYDNIVGANFPGTWFGSGSGNGWDCSLSLIFKIIEHWNAELGYRYLTYQVDDWHRDPLNTNFNYIINSIDLTNMGPFLGINYSFDFAK